MLSNRAMRRKPRKQVRVLPADIYSALSENQRRWFRALGWYMPVAGADDDDEGEGEGAGSEGEGSGEGSGAGEAGGEGEGEGEGSGSSGSGEGGGEGEGEEEDDNRIPLTRSEYERLKRIARDHDRDLKSREKEEQKLKDKQKREQGEYEELLSDKDEKIREVEAERDEARYQLDAYKRRVRVTEAAKRLGWKDPEDAFRFLSDEDSEDETSTERALKRVARTKKYLVSERRSTGAPVSGDGTTLTMEQIASWPESEVIARWDEVQKVMAQ